MGELVVPTTFREAMAEVCSPVTVVTTTYEGRPHGTTVSAFASLSLDPPMVTVALDHGSDLLAKIRQTGRLGVNVLGSGQDDLAVAFARKGVDKFADVRWRLDQGLPRLDRSVVWLECVVADVAVGGDHLVILAAVQSASVTPAAPLTYHRRGFGTHAVALPAASRELTPVLATPGFGLFLDLRNPAPWRRPWPEHLGAALDLAVEAERLGADSIWFTEHHAFEDGHLSQPLSWLTAVAARTSRVRLGTGVAVAPLQHPRHLAEQAALVDALSGGRLELGLGPGYARTEFDAFGADLEARFRRTDETLVEVRRLLADGMVGPEPVQPEIPLWLGYKGPRNAARAGRLGVGVLTLSRRAHASYRDALEEAGHGSDQARMGGTVDLVVAEDPEAAWERIRPHAAHQLATYVRAHDPGAAVPDAATLGGRWAADRPAGVSVRLAVLTVDEAVEEVVRRIEGLPVRHVYTWASVAGMPEGLVADHVRLFLTQVAPRVRERLEAAAP